MMVVMTAVNRRRNMLTGISAGGRFDVYISGKSVIHDEGGGMSRAVHSQPEGEGVDMAAKLACLSRPASYPERPVRVEVLETHMSWVFLTDRFVYKMKKPVYLPPLDLTSLEKRHRNCLSELRLNRRLARGVYLGVLPLTLDGPRRLLIDGEGEAVEWLVRMRRLPARLMLDARLHRGKLTADEVHRFMKPLLRFYARSAPAMAEPLAYQGKLAAGIDDVAAGLFEPGLAADADRVAAIQRALHAATGALGELLSARVMQGSIIEAHGDLRPEHVCLSHPPVMIDCLEFSYELRVQDVADELAFLSLECECLGADFVGDVIFAELERVLGDRPPPAVIHYYKAARAFLRARLCYWHLHEPQDAVMAQHWRERGSAYLARAEAYLARCSGVVGS